MNPQTLRVYPFAAADGATNMARDEAMLLGAVAGQASLRFYTWNQATVSLGYFQPAHCRSDAPRLSPLPWVRRPTGGATLVHHHELTYALALSANLFREPGPVWMTRFHTYFADALARQHIHVLPAANTGPILDKTLCFHQQTPGDLILASAKVLGSSQRKHHRCLLQHGALLLEQSEHTPTLPGLLELTGGVPDIDALMQQIATSVQQTLGLPTVQSDWSTAEQETISRLVETKYRHKSWNYKR